MKQLQGLFVGVAGVLLFSSKAVLVKLAYNFSVDPISLLLLGMMFSLPFYVVIAIVSVGKGKDKISRREYFLLVALGFIGYYLASYFDFVGLKYIKASLERLILFLYPTLVVMLSFLFLKEKIQQHQLIAIGVSYIGVFILFFPELSIGGSDQVLKGSTLVFLSALTYASYLVGSGLLISKFGAIKFTSYAMIVSCISVLIHYSFSGETDIFDFPREVYWLGLLMAVFATVIPSYLISYAIKKMGASNFSVLGALGPVSTIGLAYLFLNERLTVIQIVGAVVVIVGVILSEMYRKKADPQSKE